MIRWQRYDRLTLMGVTLAATVECRVRPGARPFTVLAYPVLSDDLVYILFSVEESLVTDRWMLGGHAHGHTI